MRGFCEFSNTKSSKVSQIKIWELSSIKFCTLKYKKKKKNKILRSLEHRRLGKYKEYKDLENFKYKSLQTPKYMLLEPFRIQKYIPRYQSFY